MLKRAIAVSCLGVALVGAASAAFAVQLPTSFVADNAVTSGTLDTPVGVAFLPDGRFLVAEKRGRVWLVKNGVRSLVPVWAGENEVLNNGDRGLLSVAVDPNYFVNHYIYLLYTVDPEGDGNDDNDDAFGRLTRYTMSAADSNVVDSASRTILMGATWAQGPPSGSPSHTIGTLRFAADGSLIISCGDGASFSDTDAGGLDPGLFTAGRTNPQENIGAFRAQYTGSLAGKILRIDPATGNGYPSNPYWDGNASSVPSRVWAYGFRNPYRFNIRPGTGSTNPANGNPGTLLVGEVGWGSWEEADIVATGGGNYGWPCYEGQGGSAYTSANPSHHGCGTIGTSTNPGPLKFPTMMWNHTSQFANGSIPTGLVGNASIGGVFYTGTTYPTAYRTNYFFGDFGEGWIKVAVLNASNQLLQVLDFGLDAEGPVDFTTDPITGDVFYVSINTNQVRRIRYTGAGTNRLPVAVANGSPNSGPLPLQVTFTSAGTNDPDGDPLTYEWQFGDGQISSSPNPQHTYSVTGTYTAVLSVNDGHGGTASSGVTIFAGTPPVTFPNTPVLDNFNRANGAIGGSWVGGTGGLAIASNQLKQTGGDSSPVWNGAVFGADQEAYVTLVALTTSSPEHDLMLKVQGQTWDTGHIEVRYDATQSVVMVSTYTPGIGWLTRATTGLNFSPGDRFGARARADGTVEVFRNTFLVFTTSVAGWPYAGSGGRIGLSLSGAVLSALDDFGGGTIGSAPPGNTPPHATMISPTPGLFYIDGQIIPLNGSAIDAQDPDTSLTFQWIMDLHHNNHVHPGFYNVTGRTGTMLGTNHDDGTGVYFTVKLAVTDRGGLSDTARANIYPEIDLEPSPITVTPSAPVNPGTTQYGFTILNHGRMPGSISRWRIVAGGTVVAEGDTLVGALDSVRVVRSAPTLFAGAYDLRVVVDTLAAVTETSETNNGKTQALQVTGLGGFPTTGVLDNFNRANGAVGGSWLATTGLTINTNQLAQTSGAASPVWNGATFGADQEAFVTLSAITSSSPEHDLLLKVQGTSATAGHLEVRYDAVQHVVLVSTFTPASGWRLWGTSPSVTLVAGDQFGARAKADGTVEVFRNGTKIFTSSVAGWVFAANGGRLGLTLVNATSSRLDNFGGGTYVAGPPPPNRPPVAVAGGTPSSGNAPLAVTFSGTGSSDPDGDPLGYAWSFGDGQNGAGLSIAHTYANPGTYAALLTVTDGRGGQDTASVEIVANTPPPNRPPVAVAGGTPSSGNAPLAVTFSGTGSSDPDGDPLGYAWSFGDGQNGAGLSIAHTYANPGTYAALLTVTDGRGGQDTASVEIVANTPPPNRPPVAVAGGTPSSGNAPLAVTFSGTGSSDPDGDPLGYAWSFGDGQNGAGLSIAHTYASAATYAALLTVTDGRGGQDTASVEIVANTPPPNVFPQTVVLDNFNRANGSVGGSWVGTSGLTINANQLAQNSGSSSPVWNGATFGPDQEAFVTLNVITASSPEHDLMLKVQGTAATAGNLEIRYDNTRRVVMVSTYTPGTGWRTWGTSPTVTYVAGDQLGARARADGTVEVYRNGSVLYTTSVAGWTFAAASGRIGLSLENANSSRLDNFGGGTYVAGPPPPNRAPVAVAGGTPSSGNAPLAVTFSGTGSSDPDGDPLGYAWSFGDGQNGAGLSIAHTYVNPGTYAALLTVTDGRGGQDTASVEIVANTPPPNRAPVAVAGGTPSSGNAPLAVTFSGTGSSDPDGDPLGYAWSFGDGQNGAGLSIAHTYANPGTYAALLTVTDGRGGQDTASVEIVANTAPPSVFPQTVVLDNFNRANGAVGGSWLGTTGLTINANQLAQTSGAASPVWNGATFGANQEIYVTLSAITASATEHDLMLKVQGTVWTAGHLEVRYDAVQRVVMVSTFSPASGWQLWATSPSVTMVAGDQFGARAKADGTVEVYRNGTKIFTASVAGWAFAANGGRLGLTLENATSTRIDNFGGGNIPAALAGSAPADPSAISSDPSAVAASVSLPRVPRISNGYPNPTNGAVALELTLPRAARVTFGVYDLDGREVWRDVERDYTAGIWTLWWSGSRTGGRRVPPGLYFARVVIDRAAVIRRITVLH